MITGVKLHNLHSIKDAELRFDKGRYHFLNEYVLDNKISNPIAIYGRNGSGKSSFFHAINDLVFLLVKSQNEPFPFIRNLYEVNDENSSISISFIVDNNDFEYGLETNYEYIIKEYLKCNNKTVLNRWENGYVYKEINKTIEKELVPILRVLGSASNIKDEISEAYYYLSNICFIETNQRQVLSQTLGGKNFIDNIVDQSKEIRDILKTYNSFPVYDIKSVIRKDGQKDYLVNIETDDNSNVDLPLGIISDGMYNQSLMLSVLLKVPDNGVLIIDEIEAALHPLTIKNFINEVIKRNIQLIFTSHNTNVLSYLRPDNIVFANWKNGKSSYKRLHEIYENIREVNNIEKMYLSSTFDEDIEK